MKTNSEQSESEERGLAQLGRYIYRSAIVLAFAIVFATVGFNLSVIFEKVEWHYLFLAGILAAAFLLPDAAEGSTDYENTSEVSKGDVVTDYTE